jgi:hypothetical protein
MRWLKRKAHNDGRAALTVAGFPTDRLPPVLIGVSSCRNAEHSTPTSPSATPLLRKTRRLWAARDGRCEYPSWDWEKAVKVGYLLDARAAPALGP